MIREAGYNLANVPTDLRVADFRQLPDAWNGKTFDLVTCLTTSLPHMLTDEDLVAALHSMYTVLNIGGLLVVDNGITDALLNAKPKMMPGRIHADDALYFFMEYLDERRVTFNILYVKKTDSGFSHLFTSATYSAMRISVLEHAFREMKFSQVDYFGDYKLTPYTDSSNRMLVLATK
jgi:glycine/sarcosine N-methyltransferase